MSKAGKALGSDVESDNVSASCWILMIASHNCAYFFRNREFQQTLRKLRKALQKVEEENRKARMLTKTISTTSQ